MTRHPLNRALPPSAHGTGRLSPAPVSHHEGLPVHLPKPWAARLHAFGLAALVGIIGAVLADATIETIVVYSGNPDPVEVTQ